MSRFTSTPIDVRVLTQEPRRIVTQSHGERHRIHGAILPMAARPSLLARLFGCEQ